MHACSSLSHPSILNPTLRILSDAPSSQCRGSPSLLASQSPFQFFHVDSTPQVIQWACFEQRLFGVPKLPPSDLHRTASCTSD
uniref:Uncharacterized protein n=1 Tax=Arundo donax TaxID=35708 RepID=A0A0A8XNS2_ARUDO